VSVGGGSGGSGAVRNGRRRLRRGSCRARGTGNVLRILVVLHIAGILQPTAGVVVVVVGVVVVGGGGRGRGRGRGRGGIGAGARRLHHTPAAPRRAPQGGRGSGQRCERVSECRYRRRRG